MNIVCVTIITHFIVVKCFLRKWKSIQLSVTIHLYACAMDVWPLHQHIWLEQLCYLQSSREAHGCLWTFQSRPFILQQDPLTARRKSYKVLRIRTCHLSKLVAFPFLTGAWCYMTCTWILREETSLSKRPSETSKVGKSKQNCILWISMTQDSNCSASSVKTQLNGLKRKSVLKIKNTPSGEADAKSFSSESRSTLSEASCTFDITLKKKS